jgi:hypothetical protein
VPEVANPFQLRILLDVNTAGLSLNGMPAIHLTDTDQSPLTVELLGGEMLFTFAESIVAETELVYPQQDPALRGTQGEFVAGARYKFPERTIEVAWTVTRGSSGEILLITPVGAEAPWLAEGPVNLITDNALTALSWAWTGAEFTVVMDGDTVSSASLTKQLPFENNINIEGKRLAVTEVAIT